MVERAPRLIRIDQVAGNGTRIFDGMRNRFRSYFGKYHTMQGFILEQPFFGKNLSNVPGNGLSFAVRIGRQVYGVGILGGFGYGIDVLLVFFLDFIAHGEVVIDIDRAILAGQVADMTVGSQDQKILAEIFIDRLGFRRGFHDQ